MSEERSLYDLAADFFMTKHRHYYERPLTPDEFRTALTEAIAWGSQSRWISVKDRLPEVGSETLVVRSIPGHTKPVIARRLEDGPNVWWYCSDAIWCGLESVTHWMPLPELPEEEK